jgi:hypothetical protein
MRGVISPLPPYVFMEWCLVKHRGHLTVITGLYFPTLKLASLPYSYLLAPLPPAGDWNIGMCSNLTVYTYMHSTSTLYGI